MALTDHELRMWNDIEARLRRGDRKRWSMHSVARAAAVALIAVVVAICGAVLASSLAIVGLEVTTAAVHRFGVAGLALIAMVVPVMMLLRRARHA
jgi:hypothetical protein